MSQTRKEWRELGWHAILCANRLCHRIMMQHLGDATFAGHCMAFVYKRCGAQSVFGQIPDPEHPQRPFAIYVHGVEEYRAYRRAAHRAQEVEAATRRRRQTG